ncbi:extracellular serine-rich protein [Rutstroemia sp. NJR-2017a BBW]|nr:extracellular serine-rich protein [Rutstroemia sp. NJR-2017a BBW]
MYLTQLSFATLLAATFVAGTKDPSAANAKVHTVVVGSTNSSLLVFTPQEVTANPGDTVQFQFSMRNHTVTQSSVEAPCMPIADAIHSGFVPVGANQTMVTTFDVTINDTKPIYMYCAQGKHCQEGMVMTINAGNSTQNVGTYKAAAKVATANVPAQRVNGGKLGQVAANDATTVPLKRL